MIRFHKGHIYHWQMKGSYSQKAVLPVMVADLSYEGMEGPNDSMAIDAYAKLCSEYIHLAAASPSHRFLFLD